MTNLRPEPKKSPARTWRVGLLSLLAFSPIEVSAAGPTEPLELRNEVRSPEDCRACHQFPNAPHKADQPRYDPYSWLPSLMSNASRDPVFWAGVAVAAQDVPGATELCVRCHSPRGFLAGQGAATRIEDLDPEFRDGISCDLCHRMLDDSSVEPGNAQYVIDDGQGGPPAMQGPWVYEDDSMQPPHGTVASEFLADSRLCGTCHDVTTERERVDEAGQGLGVHFNEQRTYSEWLRSAYAEPGADFASCQDCHMPAVEDVAGCLVFSQLGERHATGGRRHELLGANRFMLQVLRSLYGWEGSEEIPDELFDEAIARTDEFVRTAARLEVEAPSVVDLRAGLPKLGVMVTNLTGHKLPSGYSEGRVMWLEVVASYGDQELYTSGRWDPDDPAFVDGIEDDLQVRRYEAIAEDADDGTRLHLLRNNRWVVDNRLPPKGLRPHLDTDPVGDRYTLLNGSKRWPHVDEVAYRFDPLIVDDVTPDDAEDDQLQLRVRLLYLINTPTYVEFLRDENHSNDSGSLVYDVFEEHGGAEPVVIAEFSGEAKLIGLVAGDDDDDDSSTGDSDTGEDSGTSTGDSSGDDSGTSSGDGTSGDGSSSGGDSAQGDGSGDTGASANQADNSSGCGCRATGTRMRIDAVWAWLVLLGAVGLRRRGAIRRAANLSSRKRQTC